MAIQGSATITIPVSMTSVQVTPSPITLQPGQTKQFTALANYNDGTSASVPVTWTATGGQITSSGLYTAGQVTGSWTVKATAVSTGLVGTALITIPSTNLYWNATFESGVWPSGAILEQCQTGRISIYDNSAKPAGAPNARLGTKAAAFRTTNADYCKDPDTKFSVRSQVQSTQFIKPGMEVWSEWSVYFPSPIPTFTSDTFWMMQEDYGPPYGGNPPSAWYLQRFSGTVCISLSGRYDSVTHNVQNIYHTPVTAGQWYVIMHRKLYQPNGSGFVQAWINGTQVLPQTSMQTMLNGATTAGAFINHYRRHTLIADPGDYTVYFDHWRCGPTRASVDSLA
jgi:hypothetical protein